VIEWGRPADAECSGIELVLNGKDTPEHRTIRRRESEQRVDKHSEGASITIIRRCQHSIELRLEFLFRREPQFTLSIPCREKAIQALGKLVPV
jgi:predicted nucleotidyltransferase